MKYIILIGDGMADAAIERLGGTKIIDLDVRVIAATNANLEEAVQRGDFRDDLFYRLNVVPLTLPDLKERPEDILPLAHKFLLEETREQQRGQMTFSPAALTALTVHDWPGNVRELQNRIRRALGTTMDKIVTPVDMGLDDPSREQEDQTLYTLKEARDSAEKKAVQQALALSGNNISQAAKLLEVSRPTLHDLLKKHTIVIQK